MKKILAVAACLMLCGSLLVGGTLAADLSGMAQDIFMDLTDLLGDIAGKVGLSGTGKTVKVEIVTYGEPQMISPGGSAASTSTVKNEGTGSAYFRLAYAVQREQDAWNKLDIAFDYDESAYSVYPESGWKEIDVSGTPFMMKVFTYKQALAPGAPSQSITLEIAMGGGVTGEQLSRYRSDFLQMQALAVGAEDFVKDGAPLSAEAALDYALPLETLNPF